TDFQVSGISLRENNSYVENNVITATSRGDKGIGYSEETLNPGTTTIKDNTVSGVRLEGLAIDDTAASGNLNPADAARNVAADNETFLIQNNTFRLGAAIVG